jgi:hypothetical protein
VKQELNAELYLCAVNNFVKDIDPAPIGFDGTVQFPLDFHPSCRVDVGKFAEANNLEFENVKDNWILDYPSVIRSMTQLPKPGYRFFRGVFPSWDNTPRRQNSGAIFINSSPELYTLFLKATLELTHAEQAGEERLVFINAWNEWAEGAHLEPDRKYGLKWLEATREALQHDASGTAAQEALFTATAQSDYRFANQDPLPQKPADTFEAPLTSEVEIILNSYTFRVGRIIMWLPIRILNLLKRLKIIKNE